MFIIIFSCRFLLPLFIKFIVQHSFYYTNHEDEGGQPIATPSFSSLRRCIFHNTIFYIKWCTFGPLSPVFLVRNLWKQRKNAAFRWIHLPYRSPKGCPGLSGLPLPPQGSSIRPCATIGCHAEKIIFYLVLTPLYWEKLMDFTYIKIDLTSK